MIMVALLLALAGCGDSDKDSGDQDAIQRQADLYAIEQIEKTWHEASSTQDVDLMMTLWAPGATFNVGTETLSGTKEIRDFFTHTAAPFQPGNRWVSETPAYKMKATVDGDEGTLYFECHYVDVKTKQVVAVVGADQTVEKIDGKWLITSTAGASPKLTP